MVEYIVSNVEFDLYTVKFRAQICTFIKFLSNSSNEIDPICQFETFSEEFKRHTQK